MKGRLFPTHFAARSSSTESNPSMMVNVRRCTEGPYCRRPSCHQLAWGFPTDESGWITRRPKSREPALTGREANHAEVGVGWFMYQTSVLLVRWMGGEGIPKASAYAAAVSATLGTTIDTRAMAPQVSGEEVAVAAEVAVAEEEDTDEEEEGGSRCALLSLGLVTDSGQQLVRVMTSSVAAKAVSRQPTYL